MKKKLAETNFQTKLKTDLKDAGWKVIKLQSGMGFTVLDFFVTSSGHGPMWWELKTINSTQCLIPITRLQRNEMRDLQAAGCLSMVATCVRVGNDDHLYLTANPEEEYVNGTPIIRKFRQNWDIDTIGRRCDIERERLNLWGLGHKS